jgi:hypothetical protein
MIKVRAEIECNNDLAVEIAAKTLLLACRETKINTWKVIIPCEEQK